MNYSRINGDNFYNMMINASNKLEEQKEFVNSLNVFPVPDGDTGTNMSATLRAAVEEIKTMKGCSIGDISKKLAKGALMGARGNSGVILSQILRGIAKGLENKESANVKEFAESLMEGSRSAYKAVMRPTEGTILTIVRAAGESALSSSAEDVTKLMLDVCESSRNMLNKTPEMLPVLKKAKVVDAGGMGLLVILNGMYDALKGEGNFTLNSVSDVKDETTVPQAMVEADIKFGYCTEFIVLSPKQSADALKHEIEQYGDSMVVVGYEDLIKVHIHTEDPGLVLSKAVKLGELSKIKIENMREQHRHLVVDEKSFTAEEVPDNTEEKEYGFVAVAMGEGIKNIFNDLGVDVVIEGGQTMNPSTQDILSSIDKINAKNIFVLPNNKNIIMAATQAAELSDKNIIVIPSKTIPQGITAVTVFNPETGVEQNQEAMLQAIANVVSGSVTYAVRDTEMDGKEIREGDILGLIEGKISEVGKDIFEVCDKVISNMTTEDNSLITIFYGKDCEDSSVKTFVENLEEKYSDMDVQFYRGDQPLYYFILAVE